MQLIVINHLTALINIILYYINISFDTLAFKSLGKVLFLKGIIFLYI